MAYVDCDRNSLRLPDSKSNKPKSIYLCPEAIRILRSLSRQDNNPFIIAGTRKNQPLIGIQKIWERFRKEADLNDVRLHDLRHSFASTGILIGFSLPMLGKALGHSNTATTERYAHLADDPVQQASNEIGSSIAGALSI